MLHFPSVPTLAQFAVALHHHSKGSVSVHLLEEWSQLLFSFFLLTEASNRKPMKKNIMDAIVNAIAEDATAIFPS